MISATSDDGQQIVPAIDFARNKFALKDVHLFGSPNVLRGDFNRVNDFLIVVTDISQLSEIVSFGLKSRFSFL